LIEVINLYSGIDLKTLISGQIKIGQTSFILKRKPQNKNEKLILLASKFNNIPRENLCLFVKYPFGKREKRLELVFINENINILKISKKSFFDKDAMEMDNLLSHIYKNFKPKKELVGNLIFFELLETINYEPGKLSIENNIKFSYFDDMKY
jgi:hypothetical protein